LSIRIDILYHDSLRFRDIIAMLDSGDFRAGFKLAWYTAKTGLAFLFYNFSTVFT